MKRSAKRFVYLLRNKNWALKNFGKISFSHFASLDFPQNTLSSLCNPRIPTLNRFHFKKIVKTQNFHKRFFSQNQSDNDEENWEDKVPTPQPQRRNFYNFISYLVTFGIYYYVAERRRKPSGPTKEITTSVFFEYLKKNEIDFIEYDEINHIAYVHLRNKNIFTEPKKRGILGVLFPFLYKDESKTKTLMYKRSDFNFYFKCLSKKDFEKKLRNFSIENSISLHDLNITSVGLFSFPRIIKRVIQSSIIFIAIIYLQRVSRRNLMNNQSGGELSQFTKMSVDKHPKVNVKFSDVAGMKEAKNEVQEFVDYFDDSKKYEILGAKIPRGAIFFGEPGVGKTLLAKALAGEVDVPFYSISGSEFVEIFVGVGASRVRSLFEQARNDEKAIIFIDEIDAIGRPRETSQMFGGAGDERQNTLNQLLVELDGFTNNDNVLVFGSTNMDVEGLDKALLRPGRFDRQIYIEKPDKEERMEIFDLYLRKLKCKDDIDINLERFSNLCVGLTGADISTICNEAGINAIRENNSKVSANNVEEAIERIVSGIEKKDTILSDEEKEKISYYQAGLGLTSVLLPYVEPVLKLSLVQRGNKFGYIQHVPEEKYIHTFEEMKENITHLLSGRCTELLKYQERTTHSVSDLKRATSIAYSTVSTFGFSDEIGTISYDLPGSEGSAMRTQYGDDIAWKIDESVIQLVDECMEKCNEILKENIECLDAIAIELLEKEIVSQDRLKEIIYSFENTK